MSRPPSGLRTRLHEIIFEADTPAGRLFDLLLMVAIVSSVVASSGSPRDPGTSMTNDEVYAGGRHVLMSKE